MWFPEDPRQHGLKLSAGTAVESEEDAGSVARVATFGLDEQVVAAVKDGNLRFAVGRQPCPQGCLAVDSLSLHRFNGNYNGGGTEPVLTGPAFVGEPNSHERHANRLIVGAGR
ncbi:hypothetical protein [Streptomyces sp. NPDC002550]